MFLKGFFDGNDLLMFLFFGVFFMGVEIFAQVKNISFGWSP